ncbi:hypothetical protein [Arthrobacter sp. NPDC057013]|uniref:hypothetical protein n=1 Tax=Arthrobacter sp. NPDC057013 TaxID=3345999 RepID=UPI0036297368
MESLAELGIDITGAHSKPVADNVIGGVDFVVVLGTEAKREPREGTRFEFWETDEPPERGTESMEWDAPCSRRHQASHRTAAQRFYRPGLTPIGQATG